MTTNCATIWRGSPIRGVIHLSLSTWPLSQEEINRALKKAKPSYSSEQVVLARINQRLDSLKADFRVSGYTSTDKPGTPQGFVRISLRIALYH
ncbi:Surface assembly of capsule [Klebsiella michiganensis]|uniref:Surface assembly of capsule n=1 Tax=Klebsiella michiganensis TaxID=1134687 RepID=A0A7H4MVI4_9ENTR|nr:Surface assembly of capsule [Klebsiella michiganensis]